MKRIFVIVICLWNTIVFSQDKKDSSANWSLHFQGTVVYQSQSAFHAKYSGPKSLDTLHNEAYSQTNTLFIGRRLWKGASFYFDPEITGGQGISNVLGLAGAPNGEIYRVGNPRPTLFIAREYLQQEFPLKNTEYEKQVDDQNLIEGKVPTSRFVIQIGKFGISDFFDDNKYDHDPRSQFLNWSLMASGSWDFPADLRGYTSGIVLQLIEPSWGVRFAAVRVPRMANGLKMDWNISNSNSETLEYERIVRVHSHPGSLKFTSYITFSRAPVYNRAVDDLKHFDSTRYNVINGNAEWKNFEGTKYGFGINYEQEISKTLGMFSRLNWNDGQSATWAFTEIDRNFQLGINLKGTNWKRPDDLFGLAFAINGLSQDHANYLKKGGIGFIIGDGKLNYGTENIIETFYRAKVNGFIFLSADYQMILNPGYNKDRRGPVHIPGIRLHIEI